MSYQAYLDAIERKTGKTPAELLAEAAQRGYTPATKAAEVVGWLKDEFDLGRGHAMALYGVLKNGSTLSDKHVQSGGTHSYLVGRAAARRHRPPLVKNGEPPCSTHQRLADLRTRPGRRARLLRRQPASRSTPTRTSASCAG